MINVPIHIFLSGLIALSPDPSGTNQLTALLLDERNPPADLICRAEHHPRLVVQTTDADCTTAHCHLPSAQCTCDLDREEISLTVLPSPLSGSKPLSKKPARSLPFDESAALDFGYVANLSMLGQTLKDGLLDSSKTPPQILVARMKFPYEFVAACSLGTRRDEGSDNIHEMVLRPLGFQETGSEAMSQALAQMVIATIDSAQQVTVTLTNFDTGAQRVLHPTLPPGATDFEITLSNERDDLAVDAPCEDGVGRDFAFFYDLAASPPLDRPIPHVKYTRWKSVADIDPPECHVGTKNPMSRPICPMASFNP